MVILEDSSDSFPDLTRTPEATDAIGERVVAHVLARDVVRGLVAEKRDVVGARRRHRGGREID
jgi:hypothetical protein